MVDNVINFASLHRQKDARRLLAAVDQASEHIRAVMIEHVQKLQQCNLLDLEPANWVASIEAIAKAKALIAETYPDVQKALADLAAERGTRVTSDDALRVARELHPECFDVRLF